MATPVAQQGLSLSDVRAQSSRIHEIGRRHGVGNIRVFGSVARGESTEHSDLDLLVGTEPNSGLLALSAFALEVEDLFGVPTQVVTAGGLRQRIRESVLREAVSV